MLLTPLLRSAKPQQDKPKGWKCDCPSIITCISVIRSLNGRGLFHATSLGRGGLLSADAFASLRGTVHRAAVAGLMRRRQRTSRSAWTFQAPSRFSELVPIVAPSCVQLSSINAMNGLEIGLG